MAFYGYVSHNQKGKSSSTAFLSEENAVPPSLNHQLINFPYATSFRAPLPIDLSGTFTFTALQGSSHGAPFQKATPWMDAAIINVMWLYIYIQYVYIYIYHVISYNIMSYHGMSM